MQSKCEKNWKLYKWNTNVDSIDLITMQKFKTLKVKSSLYTTDVATYRSTTVHKNNKT